MEKLSGHWKGVGGLPSQEYTCYWCHRKIASISGLEFAAERRPPPSIRIYICYNCKHPTYFYENKQYPSPPFGDHIEGLPDDVSGLYQEVRDCTSVNALTAAVMVCRKLLMHIAVDKGADKGKYFQEYVDCLAAQYITPANIAWVDKIRDVGNAANHEIPSITREDAEQIITFTGMLLRLVYDFPGRLKGETAP
ncbi:MAG: DUF4145 domain-containing protein [Planctomycetota bacterium]|jgi:hypothetical protein